MLTKASVTMQENMNFYHFMHKQIPVVIALFAGTGLGYIYIGYLYASLLPELLWYMLVLIISAWGYKLYRDYALHDYTIEEKDRWLQKLRYFLFSYFSVWIVIFTIYVLHDELILHYVAIATQIGVVVVSATILVSQKILVRITVITSMLPIILYLLVVGEFYSYLLTFFAIVLSWVLLYASRNTYNYLVKSKFQAYHDYLTKLGNRRYFIEILDNAIKVQKYKNHYIYLLLIDLDHFKTINDTLGHDIGDILLCEVANRMKTLSLENNNKVARLGGDEFCVLSDMYENRTMCLDDAMTFAKELIQTIKETYIIEDHHLYISASVGLSLINDPNMHANTFMKEADIAMYEAKSQGRDGIMLFNEQLSQKVERRLDIERLLHFAVQNGEIALQYQPQMDQNDTVVGCEVLVRWNNQKLGSISPDEFIPISEQTGLIIELGRFILEESFKTLREWDNKGININQLSINISMRQLFHSSFQQDVQHLSQKYLNKAQREKLIFEITESSVAEDVKTLVSIMKDFQTKGIRFSMDDFGTGYSSLSYLRHIPIKELKIDKSFIAEINESDDEKNIVKTILNMAKSLDLNIVAEGVETKFQKDFLLREGCHILQGYHFSKPLDKDGFENFFLQHTIC